jgi:hypothetical protein
MRSGADIGRELLGADFWVGGGHSSFARPRLGGPSRTVLTGDDLGARLARLSFGADKLSKEDLAYVAQMQALYNDATNDAYTANQAATNPAVTPVNQAVYAALSSYDTTVASLAGLAAAVANAGNKWTKAQVKQATSIFDTAIWAANQLYAAQVTAGTMTQDQATAETAKGAKNMDPLVRAAINLNNNAKAYPMTFWQGVGLGFNTAMKDWAAALKNPGADLNVIKGVVELAVGNAQGAKDVASGAAVIAGNVAKQAGGRGGLYGTINQLPVIDPNALLANVTAVNANAVPPPPVPVAVALPLGSPAIGHTSSTVTYLVLALFLAAALYFLFSDD